MKYIELRWSSSSSDEPFLIYFCVDADGWETEKLEFFRDGSVGYSNEAVEIGSTGLSDKNFCDTGASLMSQSSAARGVSGRFITEQEYNGIKARLRHARIRL